MFSKAPRCVSWPYLGSLDVDVVICFPFKGIIWNEADALYYGCDWHAGGLSLLPRSDGDRPCQFVVKSDNVEC